MTTLESDSVTFTVFRFFMWLATVSKAGLNGARRVIFWALAGKMTVMERITGRRCRRIISSVCEDR